MVADEWINLVVDAGKGQLRTMLGKMNGGTGSELRSTGKIFTRLNSEDILQTLFYLNSVFHDQSYAVGHE